MAKTTPKNSTDMLAKQAIEHIRNTEYLKLKSFVPEDEERVTVHRAFRRKKRQFEEDVKAGRKSEYDFFDAEGFAEDYAKGESTIRELCKQYGISTQSFYNYKAEQIEFFELIKNAEEQRNDEKLGMAQRGLKKKLEGFTYQETRIEEVPVTDDKGNVMTGKDGTPKAVVRKKVVTTKHSEPSDTMIIFTLCNKDPERWKHISTIKHEGLGDDRPPVDLSQLTDEELDQYLALTKKAEGKANGEAQ